MDVRSADRPSRVLLVASHRTIRLALRQALEALGIEVCSDVPHGREAVLAALVGHPRVALVDLSTDPTSGVATCEQLRERSPCIRVVALVPRVGPAQHAARAVGAVGIVTTDASMAELAAVLTTEASGSPRRRLRAPSRQRVLTRREQEVLTLAANGLTDGQISRTLFISHKTVKNHLHHAYSKLGATSRTDAVMLGLRHGLIAL